MPHTGRLLRNLNIFNIVFYCILYKEMSMVKKFMGIYRQLRIYMLLKLIWNIVYVRNFCSYRYYSKRLYLPADAYSAGSGCQLYMIIVGLLHSNFKDVLSDNKAFVVPLVPNSMCELICGGSVRTFIVSGKLYTYGGNDKKYSSRKLFIAAFMLVMRYNWYVVFGSGDSHLLNKLTLSKYVKCIEAAL